MFTCESWAPIITTLERWQYFACRRRRGFPQTNRGIILYYFVCFRRNVKNVIISHSLFYPAILFIIIIIIVFHYSISNFTPAAVEYDAVSVQCHTRSRVESQLVRVGPAWFITRLTEEQTTSARRPRINVAVKTCFSVLLSQLINYAPSSFAGVIRLRDAHRFPSPPAANDERARDDNNAVITNRFGVSASRASSENVYEARENKQKKKKNIYTRDSIVISFFESQTTRNQ